jgi:hypothetical protein
MVCVADKGVSCSFFQNFKIFLLSAYSTTAKSPQHWMGKGGIGALMPE